MTVVDPVRDERGWRFGTGEGFSEDRVNGFRFLSEAYVASDAVFQGRVTVPVLWDKQENRIVNNSEDDIAQMFDSAFQAFTDSSLNLYPVERQDEIDTVFEPVYEHINNGVYRAGFAGTQAVYEIWVRRVFDTLDDLEARLSGHRYLVGNRMTLADWQLFCTLVRFDAVYYCHFKCESPLKTPIFKKIGQLGEIPINKNNNLQR